MKKMKYLILGAVVLTLGLSTTLTFGASPLKYNSCDIIWSQPPPKGPVLETTTNKVIYRIGEPVSIYLTNVGDEMLSGGGPIITIYNSNKTIVYQEATYCWHDLDPGESIEWQPPWDQTDKTGKQVPGGRYVVEGVLSGGGNKYVDDAVFYIGTSGIDDEIDQHQIEMNFAWVVGPFPGPYGPWLPDVNYTIAQSFIPTKNVLTRVNISIGKNRTATFPYRVAIKKELSGSDIATAKINAEDIANETFNWTEFDFPDIRITPGDPYYLISYTTNITDNWYGWAANHTNPYLDGSMFTSIDEGSSWTENDTLDMCFITYGCDNDPPNKPTIGGKTSGKTKTNYEYTITGEDPDGDELYVKIDWGDNTSSELVGPYNGSYNITKTHAWEEEGTYTISVTAKDPIGWGEKETLEVSMPKSKQTTDFQPLPHHGVSIVFFKGEAEVHGFTSSYPSITLQAQSSRIKWLSFRKPWFHQSGWVVDIHKYKGIVLPKHIVKGDTVTFMFALAKEIVVSVP
jgi:hypothetical protein